MQRRATSPHHGVAGLTYRIGSSQAKLLSFAPSVVALHVMKLLSLISSGSSLHDDRPPSLRGATTKLYSPLPRSYTR